MDRYKYYGFSRCGIPGKGREGGEMKGMDGMEGKGHPTPFFQTDCRHYHYHYRLKGSERYAALRRP